MARHLRAVAASARAALLFPYAGGAAHVFRPWPQPGCPLAAVGGFGDEEATREELARWRELTTGDFSLHMLPGDHFFLHTSQAMPLEILARHLARLGDGVA